MSVCGYESQYQSTVTANIRQHLGNTGNYGRTETSTFYDLSTGFHQDARIIHCVGWKVMNWNFTRCTSVRVVTAYTNGSVYGY